MKKYDFTAIPDRSGSGSSKWNQMPGASVERVPLTTADMEFPMAPELAEGLKEFAGSAILGYTEATEEYYKAVCNWMERRHHYHVEKEWMIQTPGVVYALGILIRGLTEPGDGVIVLSPIYYPFDLAIMASERNIVYSDLKLTGTHYSIDFEDLEKKAAHPECKVLMFCNPHNPVGRVWTIEEMKKVVDICYRNNVTIIDDEIHHDLIMPGHQHTVMSLVSEEARQICAVCTAPSKTFNLAGIQCSNIIIENPVIRAKVKMEHTLNLLSSLNSFAYQACIIAYNQCEQWLEELISVIEGNAKYVTEFMAANFPEVKVIPMEGTYLLWLDMRGLGMTHKELEILMKQDAELYLDEGYIFGVTGRGFERINLACSPLTIERSMERFKKAMEQKRRQWEVEGRPYHVTLECGNKLEGFVYDTATESGIDLSRSIQKPTIIVFSRYYSCSVCQMLLVQLKAVWQDISQRGFDLKVVLQSSQKSILEERANEVFPFELICDPEARLYDRYHVFEADNEVQLMAGNIDAIMQMGGIRTLLLNSANQEKTEGRSRQVPAVFIVQPDMTISYAHYGRNMFDIPDLLELLPLNQ